MLCVGNFIRGVFIVVFPKNFIVVFPVEGKTNSQKSFLVKLKKISDMN